MVAQFNTNLNSDPSNPLEDVGIRFDFPPSFADLDGDGDLDAFINYRSSIKYYEQDSSGNFSENTSANPLAGVSISQEGAPEFVDFDGDGDLDAFINYRSSIKYYEQDSSGNFSENTSANPLANVSISRDSAPSFADLDGDGDLDAFVEHNSSIKYYEQDDSGNFNENTSANPLANIEFNDNGAPEFADFDDDGDLDAFTNDRNLIRYYENDGSGNFSESTNSDLVANVGISYEGAPTFVDLDQDNDLDVFTNLGNRIHYYTNDGNGNLTNQFNTVNPLGFASTGYYGGAPEFVDFDGDGDLDAFTNHYSYIRYYENDGSGQFSQNRDANPIPEKDSQYDKLEFADIDGDGDLDVFANTYDTEIQYFENDGSNNFSENASANPLPSPIGSNDGGTPNFVDLDGDGDLDAFANQYGYIKYYENDGSGNFSENASANPLATAEAGNDGGAPSFADLDGDGDLDAFTNQYGYIKYYENDGSNNFSENASDNPLVDAKVGYQGTPEFVDLDGDGNMDAFTNFYGQILYYENEGNLVTGSTGGESLDGGYLDDTIDGMAGDDTISGGAGNDQIDGGGDKDRITGDMGNDIIDGGDANDFLQGGDDNDTVSGGADNDFLFGEMGNDSLTGDAGDDVIIGGEGDDFLFGGDGIDRMTGKEGSDTYVLQNNDANNIIYDFDDGSDLFAVQPNNFGDTNVANLFNGGGLPDITISPGSTDPLTSQISYDGTVIATVYGVASSNLDSSDFTEMDLGLPPNFLA